MIISSHILATVTHLSLLADKTRPKPQILSKGSIMCFSFENKGNLIFYYKKILENQIIESIPWPDA